jgi:hypothetical protein
VNEAVFQAWVMDVARMTGWRCWHVPAPMVNRGGTWVGAKQAAGIADLIMLHDDPPRLIFAEIKGDHGRLSERQREFLSAVKSVGGVCDAVEAYVWTPGMEEAIEAVLKTRILI